MLKIKFMKQPKFSFKIQFLLLPLILVLGAFTYSRISDGLLSGINTKNMDTSVKPGDDFDAYVNGTWVKNTKIPADKAYYGISYIIHDKAQEDVKAIIENSAKGNFANGSNEQKIGDFYESFMDTTARDQKGITPLLSEYKKIDAISNQSDLAGYFGYANKSGRNIPFSLGVEVDYKDPKQYMLLTWQGGIGLPDREYYFLEDAKSKEIRTKYVAHIEKML